MIRKIFIYSFIAAIIGCTFIPGIDQLNSSSRAAEPDPGTPSCTVYVTGNPGWVNKSTSQGTLIAGGGMDNDDAMRWMISKSGGGDFVVIRTNDSAGYNDYIYSDLGGVDSVHTLVIDSRNKANSYYVRTVLRNAEAIFIAGGDQTLYYDYWNDTELEDAILYAAHTKSIPLGGTSAGAAIMGGWDYIPEDLGVISDEALDDPYHEYMNSIRPDFIQGIAYMNNVITDTHFYERDRMGRSLAFLARMIVDEGVGSYDAKAICVDEGAAVCISGSTAKVFGSYAYFLKSNGSPEICKPGSPLDWYRSKGAVKRYRVRNGQSFDLNRWSGGRLKYIYVDYGTLRNPY
jgi:cyanophycinase